MFTLRFLVALACLLRLDQHTPIVRYLHRLRRARQRSRYLNLIARGVAMPVAARAVGLPVISGGEDAVLALFPDLPENLAELDVDALQALEDQLLETFRRVREVNEDDEAIANLATDDVIRALERGAEQIETVRTRRDELAAASEAAQARIDEIAARVEGTDGDDPPADPPATDPPADDPPADPAPDPAADPAAAEPVTAAGRVPVRGLLPRRARRNAPPADDASTTGSVVLLTEVPGVGQQGDEIRSLDQLTAAFSYRFDRLRGARGAQGGERFPVVSLRWAEPKHKLSREYSDQRNQAILAAAIQDQGGSFGPLVAHGGVCAPLNPRYTFPNPIYEVVRPIRDVLPAVGADRGGISFILPPTLSSLPGAAVGDVTAAEDVSVTSSDYTKTYTRVTCPSPSEVLTDAVFWQLEFGVQQAKTWPELVQYWLQLTLAAYARFAETRMLNSLKAGSTVLTTSRMSNGVADAATTPNIVIGFAANLIRQLRILAAGYRSRNRMTTNAPLRILLPSWVLDAFAIDVAMRKPDEPDAGSQARFEQILGAAGFNPAYYLDSSTTPATIFAAQNAGALIQFPASFLAYVFADGTWVYLDGGTLDLGVVRDANLVNTNDYRVFFETFENIAKVDNESYAVTIDTCINGVVSAGVPIEC
jgi:hypothetical protein